jgi:ubiquitin carboxyl-terminal hydrolase 9/13
MSRLGIFKAKPAPAPIITSAPPLTAEQKREATNASYWDAVEGNTDDERLWGLENFGNTCYCNSVLQALYNCEPFKQFVESYPSIPPPTTALGPPPGEANFPKKDDPPSSPLATKRDNPFDSPAQSSPARGWKLGRRQSSIAQEKPATPVEKAPERRIPLANYPVLPLPDPNQPPPSVFETIQTLFHHLTVSPPHQPLPSRKDPKKEQEQVQTASVLAAPSTPTSPSENKDLPQGPPLLASLPPPSAPRGGGPFSAGSLGRGVVRPEDVLKTIKRENEMFRGMAQQDAHEFLGWVLNKVSEEVEQVDKHLKGTRGRTFVQNLFEGCLTNETRCLSCETVRLYHARLMTDILAGRALFGSLHRYRTAHLGICLSARILGIGNAVFEKQVFLRIVRWPARGGKEVCSSLTR